MPDKDQPKGVYNPFAAEKKDFKPSVGDVPYNTEFDENSKPDIRLDGGSHVIVLQKSNTEDVALRLGELIHDVAQSHLDFLAQRGIALGKEAKQNTRWKRCAATAPHLIELPTPRGPLSICAVDVNEDEAFQRLGEALAKLPIRKILRKHQTKIVVRR